MTATILSFGRRQLNAAYLPPKMPWQNQDLAELFRVRDRLCAAGLSVEVESGVSDEGDPWFVYQQSGTDNVVVHIARIDMEIHVVNCVTGGVYKGTSFREVSDRMLEDAPLALGTQIRRGNNVVLHPSAFLTAFVAAAIMLVDLLEHGRAEAAESSGSHHSHDGDGHGFVFVSSHSAENHEAGAPHPAEGAPAENAEGAAIPRRIGKEGPAQPQSVASVASGISVAPVSVAAVNHSGLLAEAPGSGASFALTAGMFAAELLRVFHEESRAHGNEFGGTSFSEGFSALLSAFVSSEGASGKTAAPLFALTDSAAVASAETAQVEHHAVQIVSGNHADPTMDAKAAKAPEPAHSLTADLHQTALVVEKAAVEFYKAMASQSPAATSAHATEAKPIVNASSTPVSEAATTTTPETANAGPAAAKPAPVSNQEIAWIVSQVVKHDVLSLSENTSVTQPSLGDTAKIDDKVSAKPLPDKGYDAVALATGASGQLIAHLVAGHAEVVQYEKGTTLTVEGFVLGEDLLSFGSSALGDAMGSKAHIEGTDLVLGDADTGQVRLVGVLNDPTLLGHHGTVLTAA